MPQIDRTPYEPATSSEFGAGGSEILIHDVTGELYTLKQNGAVRRVSDTTAEQASFTASGSGAVSNTVAAKLQQAIPSILDFIPTALHAGIKARSDTTNLASYIAAAYAAHDLIYWPAGRYYTESSVDLTAIFGAGVIGDQWNGTTSDWSQTEIVINATNTPGLMLWGPVRVENIFVKYLAQQSTANTSSRTIEFNNIANGVIKNVKAAYGNTNFGIKQSNFGASGFNALWNSSLDELYSQEASECHFDFRNFTGGGTNTFFGNLYVHGGGSADFVTVGQTCNYAMRGVNWGAYTFGCIAVDAVTVNTNPFEISNAAFTFSQIRLEAVKYTVNNDSWVRFIGGSCNAFIDVLDLDNCKWDPSAASSMYLLRTGSTQTYLNVGKVRVQSDCDFGSSGTRRVLFNSAAVSGTGFFNEIHLHNVEDQGSKLSDTIWTENSIAAQPYPVRTLNGSRVNMRLRPGRSASPTDFFSDTAAPTTLARVAGDLVVNSAPAAGESMGWMCISAGTPGTWAAVAGIPLVNNTAVGNVGGGEDDLCSVTLPASVMINASSGIRITAWGTGANNAAAKTLKLYFGSQIILTTSLTANQVDTWRATATVWRTSASNQDWESQLLQAGTASLIDVENGTATQTETNTIVVKCTGEATNNNDIVNEGLIVELLR